MSLKQYQHYCCHSILPCSEPCSIQKWPKKRCRDWNLSITFRKRAVLVMSDFFCHLRAPYSLSCVMAALCTDQIGRINVTFFFLIIFFKDCEIRPKEASCLYFCCNFTPRLYLAFHAISNGSLNDFDGTPWSLWRHVRRSLLLQVAKKNKTLSWKDGVEWCVL